MIVKTRLIASMMACGFTGAVLAGPQNVVIQGAVTTAEPSARQSVMPINDMANAEAMPLPKANTLPEMSDEIDAQPVIQGQPGFSKGSPGDGKLMPEQIPEPSAEAIESSLENDSDSPFESNAYGTGDMPYTTSRVDLPRNNVSASYPFRAAGKLYFKDGSGSYVCSASLIKRGVIVTAAHCVASFGEKRYFTNFTFVPALTGSTAPYGVWGYDKAVVMTSYYNGTDSCYQRGVICKNDVAVIRLAPKTTNPTYPGTSTGWFGYGWNGWGFTSTSPRLTLVNQLGYPVSHDRGVRMQRTDAQGYINTTLSGNTVWGSRQTGGSSGGPELNNLGSMASLAGTEWGTAEKPNMVIGTTSWGYTNNTIKVQGASPFTSTNIVPLVKAVCGSSAPYHAACQ